MSKSSLITELNLEHRQILELVQGFGKNDFDQAGVSGAWTAKDVFGHLAYWNGEAAEAIALAVRGERPTPWLDGEIDEINQREVAARRELSLYQVMDEFRISLRAVTTVLERATDNQLGQDLEFKSDDGQMANGAWVAQALIQHYRSHREAMQVWLTKN